MASMNERIWENGIKMYLGNYVNLTYILAKHDLNIFSLLLSFCWVIPRRLNFIFLLFGTLSVPSS
jgi:hypothetical protein